ncbi:unnamed protein product [Clonostachys rosea f. rosea IK726]|uniref:Uncharacterized protein n=1 Tax=Clonostachys rosea f. rosea IK726 TaxID=1349383 RepID=A0ACA9UDG4_BIOOC|nr:unnamed protein product [Clonostachys rosea f. rosea IK726]
MLFSKAYIQSLLLFSVQSALANPVPQDGDDGLRVRSSTDELPELAGEPLLFKISGDETQVDLPVEIINAVIEEQATRDLETRATEGQLKAVTLHNNERKKKNLANLVWDAKLAPMLLLMLEACQARQAGALLWKLATQPRREPRPRPFTFKLFSGYPLTSFRLNERSKYHNEIIPNGNFGSYGHYTQAMWKSTKKMGIAAANDGKGNWWIVARYSPPGNVVGQRPY